MAGNVEKFLVKFGMHSKVIAVIEESELLIDIELAYKRVSDFPKNYIVKYEHKDFGLVDLDDPSDLEQRKNNILIVETLPETKLSDSHEDEQPVVRQTDEIYDTCQGDAIASTTSSTSNASSSWPHPFLIKDHMVRESVRGKLHGKKGPVFLSESERTSVCAGIYDEFLSLCNHRYPSPLQYSEIITALFNKYPSLSQESLTYGDSHDLWKERLKNYFKRQRFRLANEEDQEVLLKRQKYGKRKMATNNGNPAVPLKKPLFWGVMNFLPDIEEGEDEQTFSHYQNEMIAQMKKTRERRDFNKIEELMTKTFSHRRKLLIKDLVRLKELISFYPLLCDGDQILAEFKRITGWELEERLKFSLNKYGAFLVSHKSAAEKDSLENLRIIYSSTKSENERKYYMMCIALLSIPFHLRETPLTYFDIDEDKSTDEGLVKNQPRLFSPSVKNAKDISCIFDADEFEVKVEDFVIARPADFFQAMLVLIASFYVFNTEYQKSNMATFIFIQKFLLNITDKSKIPEKVSKFIGLVKKGSSGM